jgi:hypothetical protein
MIDAKLRLRKLTSSALKLVPASFARYLLKSYWYEQSMQDRLKYHIVPYRYYTPIANVFDLDVAQLSVRRSLPGIAPDLSIYFPLLDRLKPYAGELHHFPGNPDGKSTFWFHNQGYGDFDAITLYSLIRHLKPKKIVEVGSGYSSRVITLAVAKNNEGNIGTECLFIEPYPAPYLLEFKLGGPLLVKRIQEVPLGEFTALAPGDILFIDTSHVLKTQNDLYHILINILPALARGVYIHFHDIFTPYEYPEDWLLKLGRHWNEQYVLEALLANGCDFEVVLPVHGLWRDYPAKLAELLPFGKTAPGAFWVKR